MTEQLTRDDVIARLRGAGCVFAEEEADLLLGSGAPPPRLADMIDRRVAGQPLEHLLGWVAFAGLRLAVAPGVFVPRRRTELMVAQAAALAHPGATVLDLCCGCGAVSAALSAMVAGLRVYAADVDPAAVACARDNLPGAHVVPGDLFTPLPAALRGAVDLLVCNAPYVPSGAIALMPPEARDHEPRTALDGGPDGLDIIRRVAAQALEWLRPGGYLLVETGEEQAATAVGVFAAHGLDARVARDDELGATVVIGGSATDRTRART